MGNQHSSERSGRSSSSPSRRNTGSSSTASSPLSPRSRGSSNPSNLTNAAPLNWSDQIVDGGTLEPQSWTYASSIADYSRSTVHKLITDRRLAPFYLGLQDFEDDWNSDQVIQALIEAQSQATKNLTDALEAAIESVQQAEANQATAPPNTRKSKEAAQQLAIAVLHRERLSEIIKHRDKNSAKNSPRSEQSTLYTNRAIECPICFLYYPPPLVHTRCCDQPICTECFVQIKRAEPDPTHLESEPAACPYCMEPNFGCVYNRETHRPNIQPQDSGNSSAISLGDEALQEEEVPKPRRKSFAHTEKEVVTTDLLHPDWEAKLEAVKATVARRANRRIVFRQVGDRLIPVGVTSGRNSDGANATITTAQLPPGFITQVAAAIDANHASGGRSSRSSRRRNQEIASYLQSMGIEVGQDLEEMMVEEAMRLSMQEEEDRRKKEREEEAKRQQAGSARASIDTPRASTDSPRSPPRASGSPPTSAATATLMSEAIDAPMSSLTLQSQGSRAATASSSTTVSMASAPPRLPPLDLDLTPVPARSHAPAAAGLQGSAPLAPTPSVVSVASSTFSSVTDPLASGAGYEPLGDDEDDDDDAIAQPALRQGTSGAR